MSDFKGRAREMDILRLQLDEVAASPDSWPGRAVILTGRRRVGKTRLVHEFARSSGVPYLIFHATRGRPPTDEFAALRQAIAQSNLPRRDQVQNFVTSNWNGALELLAQAVPTDKPSVVVLDEVPWFAEQDPVFEGALQTVWDQKLIRRPVLLILVGSDLSMMERMQHYDRPFFRRAVPMRLRPLNPAEVGEITQLPPADVFDAYLLTGGFPELVRAWKPGMKRTGYLRTALANPLSPLLVAGQLTLAAEFPEPRLARRVLEAIGTGERTYGAVASAVGAGDPLPSGVLAPILRMLVEKQVVAVDLPLSTKLDQRNKRYRVADPYLRFWLSFLRNQLAEVEGGEGDVVLRRIEAGWTSWRGQAVEPVVREALARMNDERFPDTWAVGGWWNRQNNPEVDLVGADQADPARAIHFVGSIKWRDDKLFDAADRSELTRACFSVPGATSDTPLVAVSRSGVAKDVPLAAWWGPEELLQAFEARSVS